LLKQLNQVKPASFSFAAAQSLQKQLQQAEPRPAASAVRPNVPATIEPGTHYRRKDPPPVRVPDHNWLPDRPEPLW
jgi:hypothetical protein